MSQGNIRDRKFFQDILQQTLVAPDPASTIEPEELQALIEVARRHREAPLLSLDPICIDLVRTLLGSYFRIPGDLPPLWQSIAAEIARTLFEDKVFSERLNNLWAHLLEASR